MKPFVTAALLLFLAAPLASARCYTYPSKIREEKVDYCIERTRDDLPPEAGETVAYYFHGLNADQNHWTTSRYPETLEMLKKEGPFPPITVVTFSTSHMSYFIDKFGETHGKHAYETWFVNEFVPFIEKTRNVCAKRECRLALGHSMGGMGALNMGLRHPELFSVVAVNSPCRLPFNLFDDDAKWKAYFDRHPLSQTQGTYLLWDGRRGFVDAKNMEEHDPITLIRRWPSPQTLPILYYDVGGRDHYGFDEGFGVMKSVMAERGFTATTDFYPLGTHNIEDEPLQRENLLRFVKKTLSSERPSAR